MKRILIQIGAILASAVMFVSCQSDDSLDKPISQNISSDVLLKIKNLGFSTASVRKTSDGYLVEGDINLTEELLNDETTNQLLRVGAEEQYRTTNLVTRLPRVITIKVVSLGTAFVRGTDIAISRYNNLGLRISFRRITSGTASITIQGFNEAPSGGFITLGSAGFPTSSGNPYRTILMNTNANAYGTNPDINYVGAVLLHEIGHCIGFRHTDFRDRSYSCGGNPVNEGASNIGAILINGTPSGPDPNSWMLACSNGGDRTFNANDENALYYLY